MFKNLSIGGRFFVLLLVMFLFLILSGTMFMMQNQELADYGMSEIQKVMFQEEKGKIEVATKTIALSLGEELKDVHDQDDKVEFIRKAVDKIRFEKDKSGYFFVYRGTVNVALPTKKAVQGKDLKNAKDKNGVYFVQDLARAALSGGGFVSYVFDKPGKGIQPKLGYAEMIPGTDMWIGTGVYIDNIDEVKARINGEMISNAKSGTIKIGIIVGAVLIFLVLPLCLYMIRTIVRPLHESTEAASKVASGDLDVKLNPQGRNEISTLQSALNSMVVTLSSNLENIKAKSAEAEEQTRVAKLAAKQADEALRQAEGAKKEGMQTAADKLESVLKNIVDISKNVEQSTEEIMTGSDFQKQRIAETATAMEEMTATVLEVAQNASETNKDTEQTRNKATEGHQVVQRTIESMLGIQKQTNDLEELMDKLNTQSTDIGKVIGVINDIADQTNLLALNAAIEAARAGEAGRGFAVVADEVRKLAEKTIGATDEVEKSIALIQSLAKQNISGMQSAVKAISGATEYSRTSGDVLAEIVELAGNAAGQVQSIATAAEEQSATSEEINRSIAEIDSMTEDNAKNSMRAAEGAKDLSGEVDALVALVEELRR
ncbi:methyl-accepting chemotaxis protein [Maridesulfovibrio ferrireducens]|uniref:methyl-accepting chemotaxis protein n=1 Tax=Maridesulfovibrio ferrireducens TaxID=246191 RepID=UPI001A2AFFED|nr:methyl-accepting chemotaxis protein [Maridesulfovibrio ferrireducens]MBI9110597.1 cache domain-containing protein [Maridesulfovibrio ferrireducens]